MNIEATLTNWTSPSSDTELEKQERTERMIGEAISEHRAFDRCSIQVYAKGSYANNTNVRADSDVDISVECTAVEYWEEASSGAYLGGLAYEGSWTPEKLRAELGMALAKKFSGHVDASGKTAFRIHSSSTRVDADVVPCFSYRYHFADGTSREGTKIFTTKSEQIVNYPVQQLENGRAKNTRTGYAFKKTVRVLKRVENAMLSAGVHGELPSYFVECLAYNCPDSVFSATTWTATIRGALLHIWSDLQNDEPRDESRRWREVNDCFFLFHPGQKWTRADGRAFAQAAWTHLGYS